MHSVRSRGRKGTEEGKKGAWKFWRQFKNKKEGLYTERIQVSTRGKKSERWTKAQIFGLCMKTHTFVLLSCVKYSFLQTQRQVLKNEIRGNAANKSTYILSINERRARWAYIQFMFTEVYIKVLLPTKTIQCYEKKCGSQ